MMSDVLSDAVRELDAYIQDGYLAHYTPDIGMAVLSVRDHMALVRSKLDACPPNDVANKLGGLLEKR